MALGNNIYLILFLASYAVAIGMLLHINGKLTMGKFKPSPLL
jgi:hypothetical protein